MGRLTCLRRKETPAACTPLPDYTAMLSPQLRQELTRFGLKAVPRRKATLLLNHIYEKTHPLVPITPQAAASPLSSHRRSLAKASARRISTTDSRPSTHGARGERSKEERRKVEEERSKEEEVDNME